MVKKVYFPGGEYLIILDTATKKGTATSAAPKQKPFKQLYFMNKQLLLFTSAVRIMNDSTLGAITTGNIKLDI